MTILELLDQLPNTTVYAGHKGLKKKIRTISLIDAPSAVDWLKGGEVIISSAFLYKDDELQQIEFIRTLIRAGCCALGIKFGRYIDKLPPEAIELAENSDFPIFGIPMNTVWSDVLAPFFSYQYSERTSNGISPTKIFSFPKSASISSNGNFDSQFCACFSIPAVITVENYEILGYNARYGSSIYKEYCTLCREYSKGIDLQHFLFDNHSYNIVSISLNSMHTIHLFLDENYEQIYNPNDLDWISSLYMTSIQKNLNSLTQSELWYFFLKEFVVNKSNKTFLEFPQIAAQYSGRDSVSAVIIFSSASAFEAFKQSQSMNLNQQTAILEYGRVDGEYVAVYSRFGIYDLHDFIKQLNLILGKISSIGRIYLGKAISYPDELPLSYRTAKSAQTLGNQLCPEQSLISYSSLEFIDILIKNKYDYSEISRLDETITSFDAIDTLEKYLIYPNIRQAANIIHLQPNSMRYRIKQIEQCLSLDLSLPMTRTDLLIKIVLYKIANSRKSK